MPDVFIGVPIEYDETNIYQTAIERIRARYPGWTPAYGSKIDMLLRLCAYMAAIGAENASSVDVAIFRTFGMLTKNPPNPAVSATVQATFTVADTAGYRIPAFTPVGLRTALMSQPLGFQTLEDIDIHPGDTTGLATLVAIDPGAAANDLNLVVRADNLPYVSSVTLIGTPDGGADAENTQVYIDRLSRQFELWTDTPIRGKDFARRAATVPGIFRCAAWENFNPADDTADNERYVTLCPIDIGGNGVGSTLKTSLQNLMLSIRETGFICPVVDPTQTTIDVTYTAHAISGTAGAVEAQILAALQAYINAGTWGTVSILGTVVPVWNNTPVLRLNKVIQVIENVATVDWAEPVTIGVHGGSLAAADINLTGAFPLPVLGTVTPTISFA